METYIVEVDCKDHKGLFASITRIVEGHDLNIIAAWEYVHKIDNMFFMRADAEGKTDRSRLLNDLMQILPTDAMVKVS